MKRLFIQIFGGVVIGIGFGIYGESIINTEGINIKLLFMFILLNLLLTFILSYVDKIKK